MPTVLAATLLASPTVGACPNPLSRQRMSSRIVEAAEQALTAGRYRRAYALTEAPTADDPGLYRRALAIHVTAALRRGFTTWVPDNKSSEKPIVATMRQLLAAKPDDPWLKARLAEALADTGEDAQARAILEALATADLVPDPAAWGALAQLRERLGDAAGASAATERCRATTQTPTVCTPLVAPHS